MTLRHRLIAFSAGLIGVFAGLLAVALVVMHVRVRPDVAEHLRRKARAAVTMLAVHAELPLASEESDLIANAVAVAARDPDVACVEVADAAGVVRASRGACGAQGLSPSLAGGGEVEDEDHVHAARVLSLEGIALGYARVAVSKARLTRMGSWLVLATAITCVAVLLAIVFSLRFAASFVSPLDAMMSFARDVARGDFQRRLPDHAPGELRQLAASLNAMAEGLQTREQAVVTRSEELARSLAQLRAAQSELMMSTRLASVGEMAGRTAHEVLNPVTGMRGRLIRMANERRDVATQDVAALSAVVKGWREEWQRGGLACLVAALEQRVARHDGGERALVEEDLEVLDQIGVHLYEQVDAQGEHLRFLLRELDRITRIVDGMRNLTRHMSTPAVVCVREPVGEAIEILRDGLEKRHIRVNVDAPEEAPVLLDRYELIQVLTNLLRNAMQAVEDAHGRSGGRIDVSVRVREDRVEVRIEDDGTGIAGDHLALLFESRFTTRPASEGTGLGLTISRRLVGGFGGRIKVERTRVGAGTVVLVDLPRHESGVDGRTDVRRDDNGTMRHSHV